MPLMLTIYFGEPAAPAAGGGSSLSSELQFQEFGLLHLQTFRSHVGAIGAGHGGFSGGWALGTV
jgi:hypothetical protein